MDKTSWYSEENFHDIYYTGIASYFQKRLHGFLEQDRSRLHKTVLEFGATHGQHIKYVYPEYDRYTLTDIVISDSLARFSSHPKCEVVACDILNVGKSLNKKFDQVISTCLLHHVRDVDLALENTYSVLSENGIADFLVPNDPSIVWNVGRILITFPKALAKGWTWSSYWAYVKEDHINNVKDILQIFVAFCENNNYVYSIDTFPKLRFFPVPTLLYRLTLRRLSPIDLI